MFLLLELEEKAREDERKEKLKQEQLRSKKAELDKAKQELTRIIRLKYLIDEDYGKIILLLNEYETKTGERLHYSERLRTDQTINGKSCLILEVIQILKDSDFSDVRPVLEFFKNHLKEVRTLCLRKKDLFLFDPVNHDLDRMNYFRHDNLIDKLMVIEVMGDGNCLWNSISVSLFGDYSMMESLRLLTASTLLENEKRFSDYLKEQQRKYGYSHELGFDGLVGAATELQVWGDELHIMALSLALERPVYSYGSLQILGNDVYGSYDEFRDYYERTDLPNHFKYIANAEHERNRPILLYYNGENHYSVVLPTDTSVEPLVPHSQIIDPIVDNKPGIYF